MSAILKFDLKKITTAFLRRKLSKLHKKDTILHVAFTCTCSLKQGETRTSSGPFWVPLSDNIEHVK